MVQAKKSLGQHFLMHARIAARMVHASLASKHSIVVEVGPGTGILTRELLKIARQVIAIEADLELCKTLRDTFAAEIASKKLVLMHADIREVDFNSFPRGYLVVANIPYYITGELFKLFLTAENQPAAMTLLVQKEVAERIARVKKESILSLSVKAYGTPKYEFTVPRGAFRPAPRVDSAVLSIKNISRKSFGNRSEEKRFFGLVHAGFAHKRKIVSKNLSGFGKIAPLIPDKARAEDLPLSFWLMLAHTAV